MLKDVNSTENNGKTRLSEIKNGIQVRIASFEGEPDYRLKLNRYGLFQGDLVRVVRHAPFDGPVLLEVRGMELALGKNIAEYILVEVAACDLP
jgi:Fe2+ transport system protein FeoA